MLPGSWHLVSIVVATAAAAGRHCGHRGEGEWTHEVRTLGEFTSLFVTNGISAEVVVGGDAPLVNVSACGNTDIVETQVVTGELVVRTQDGTRADNTSVAITVEVPLAYTSASQGAASFAEAVSEGAVSSLGGHVEVGTLNSSASAVLSASGGGVVSVGSLTAEGQVMVSASSGGSVFVAEGSTRKAAISASSMATVSLAGHRVKKVQVYATNATVELPIAGKVQGSCDNHSQVRISGRPATIMRALTGCELSIDSPIGVAGTAAWMHELNRERARASVQAIPLPSVTAGANDADMPNSTSSDTNTTISNSSTTFLAAPPQLTSEFTRSAVPARSQDATAGAIDASGNTTSDTHSTASTTTALSATPTRSAARERVRASRPSELGAAYTSGASGVAASGAGRGAERGLARPAGGGQRAPAPPPAADRPGSRDARSAKATPTMSDVAASTIAGVPSLTTGSPCGMTRTATVTASAAANATAPTTSASLPLSLTTTQSAPHGTATSTEASGSTSSTRALAPGTSTTPGGDQSIGATTGWSATPPVVVPVLLALIGNLGAC